MQATAETPDRRWPADLAWILVWGIASSAWCLSGSTRLGATFDETTYVTQGLERWRSGECKGLMRLGTMPLPVDVQTLPLHVYERATGQRFDTEAQLGEILPWARAMTLVFWWLLLVYGFLAGRQIGGTWAGRLAVAVLACEPCFLAHATLATTDIAVTACLLALAFHFRAGRERAWFQRLFLPGFWFGAALLAKASSLVFGPLCLILIECERLFISERPDSSPPMSQGFRAVIENGKRLWQSLARDMVWIVAGGLVLTFIYIGSDWKAEPSFIAWAEKLPEGSRRTGMLWLSEHLQIFSNAGEGLVQQVKHNVRGHVTYLLGKHWTRYCWNYFWVLPFIKLSLPVLLMPLLVAIARPRSLLNWASFTAFALFLCAPGFRVQLGIRLILPLVALAIVGLSAALVMAIRATPVQWVRGLLSGWAVAGVAWTLAAAVSIWPDGLCFVNELWGGPERGYLCVSDTDYDWGQGLKELKQWQQQAGLSELDLWYFGTDPAAKLAPFHPINPQTLLLHKPEDFQPYVQGHFLAVSATILYGGYFDDQEAWAHAMAFVRAHQPAARTATFFIYDFTNDANRCRQVLAAAGSSGDR
jgi:hypothetical protein